MCNLYAIWGTNFDFSKKCIDNPLRPCYNNTVDFGVWHSLVVRMVRVHEVAGSNPVTPTIKIAGSPSGLPAIFTPVAPRFEHATSADPNHRLGSWVLRGQTVFLTGTIRSARVLISIPAKYAFSMGIHSSKKRFASTGELRIRMRFFCASGSTSKKTARS